MRRVRNLAVAWIDDQRAADLAPDPGQPATRVHPKRVVAAYVCARFERAFGQLVDGGIKVRCPVLDPAGLLGGEYECSELKWAFEPSDRGVRPSALEIGNALSPA